VAVPLPWGDDDAHSWEKAVSGRPPQAIWEGDTRAAALVELEAAEAALTAEVQRLRVAIRGARAALEEAETGVPALSPALLTVEQAARQLHASRSRVFQLLAAGELEGVRVGRARCVPRKSIEAFLGRLGAA